MKARRSSRRLTIMIAIGLFIISASSVLGRYLALPDMAAGGITGFGIGIMIVALVWERKGLKMHGS